MKTNKNFDSELIARMSKMFNNEKKESCCCNDNKCDCGTEIPITFVGILCDENKFVDMENIKKMDEESLNNLRENVDKKDKCKCEEQKCCENNCTCEMQKKENENVEITLDMDNLKKVLNKIFNTFNEEESKNCVKENEDEEIEFQIEEDDELPVDNDFNDDENDVSILYEEKYPDIKDRLYFETPCGRMYAKFLWYCKFSKHSAEFSFTINASKTTLDLYSMIIKNRIDNKEFKLFQFAKGFKNTLSVPINTFVLNDYEVDVDENLMNIKLKSIN